MAPGIIYAIGSMICLGLADIVYKRGAAAGVRPHHFLMVQAWIFAPTVFVYGWATGTAKMIPAALWGSAVGLASFVAFYNFLGSLRTGSVSINAPIFRLSFAFTAALAIAVLGEPLTFYKLAGLSLTLLAVWLLLGSTKAVAGAAPRITMQSLVQVVIAMLTLGLANFLYKVGLRAGATPATLLVAQAALFVVLATVFGGSVDRGIRPPRLTWAHAPFAGIFLVVGLVLMLESLSRGEASVLVPITQMGFVVSAAIGFAALGEPFTARKGAGLICALGAIVCLARG